MYRSVAKEIRYDDSDFKMSEKEKEDYRRIKFAIENAKKLGYLQIELYVSVKNERAIALYEKHGFKNYGTRPRELLLDSGEFTDGYFMVLMLD